MLFFFLKSCFIATLKKNLDIKPQKTEHKVRKILETFKNGLLFYFIFFRIKEFKMGKIKINTIIGE